MIESSMWQPEANWQQEKRTYLSEGQTFVWKVINFYRQQYTSYLAYTAEKDSPVLGGVSVRTPLNTPRIIDQVSFCGRNPNVDMVLNGLGFFKEVVIFNDVVNSADHAVWNLVDEPQMSPGSSWSVREFDGEYHVLDHNNDPKIKFWTEDEKSVNVICSAWETPRCQVNIIDVPYQQLLLMKPENWGVDKFGAILAGKIKYYAGLFFPKVT